MSVFGSRRRPEVDATEVAESEFVAAVVEELTDPVVAIGTDGLVRSNRRARQLHRLPREPLPRDQWVRRHRVYGRGSARALTSAELPLLRALTGEDVPPVEVEVRDAGGPPEVFVVSARPIRRGRRGVIGALSILRARPQADEASAFPYADVLGHAADGIAVICAQTGAIIYTNDAWNNALGYRARELAGQHVSAVTAPSDRPPPELAAEMHQALERGGVWRGEVALRRRDGATVCWEQTVSRYVDAAGRPAWIIVGRDVGARRIRAQELHDAERQFRTAFEALPVAATLVDDEGRVLAVNDALVILVGMERERLLGLSFEDVVEPADAEAARVQAALVRRGDLNRYQVRARCLTAGGATVLVTTTIVRDVGRQPLHAVVVIEPDRGSAGDGQESSSMS